MRNKKPEEGGKASQVAAGGPEQRLVSSLTFFPSFRFPDPSSALAFPFHLFLTSPLNFPSLPPSSAFLSHFSHVLGLGFKKHTGCVRIGIVQRANLFLCSLPPNPKVRVPPPELRPLHSYRPPGQIQIRLGFGTVTLPGSTRLW